MVGLIKKQLLKHLSKFAKNLSADKIHLSTLRGEGELSNLELDCVALQNVMDLPTWLQINHATCNKVHVKIPWTKLKTTPISIFLDAVEVDMTTCERPRQPNGPSPIQASASSGDTRYGFTQKVLEGMTVIINSISVKFTSAAFNANFELSQLCLVSTNPNWEITDLKFSYIKDKSSGQVLTFKKLSLQTMRIVANAGMSSSEGKSFTTPLRLITNQCEFQMTVRRKTSDCSVLASRLHIIFDDLLWVLSDSQVQSALLCVKSLRDTIERSSQQMMELGLAKSHDIQQSPAATVKIGKDEKDDLASSKLFQTYSIIESSLHLDFDKVDLHICEESSPLHKASRKAGLQGGAIQISLHSLKVDRYPYHKPASGHRHFRDYGETMTERDGWAQGMVDKFRSDFAVLTEAVKAAGTLPTTTGNSRPARLMENCLIVRLRDIDVHQVTTSNSKKQPTGSLVNSTRKELHLPEEMPLLHFIRSEYYYPDGRDFPAPHDNIFMQINAPQVHVHWDSLIWLHRLSTVTVQAVQKMLKDLGIVSDEDIDPMGDGSLPSAAGEERHVDIRIQVLMPKVFVPGPTSTHHKQPHGVEIQVSKVAVTNCRGQDSLRKDLKNVLEKIESQHFARKSSAFPNENGIDLPHSQELFDFHARGEDDPLAVALQSGKPMLTRNVLIAPAAKDVWSADVDNIWVDFVMPSGKKVTEEQPTGGFLGLSKVANDPVRTGTRVPFLDSFPAQLWVGRSSLYGTTKMELSDSDNGNQRCLSPAMKSNDLDECRTQREEVSLEKTDAISHDRISVASSLSARDKVLATHILLQTNQALRLQLDHYQYLFLLRLIDMIEEFEKRLESSAREALSSARSSVSSTPSYSMGSHGDVSNRYRLKKLQPVNTTSVRLSAPSADLFLILRPPSPRARETCENHSSGTAVTEETTDISSAVQNSLQKTLSNVVDGENCSSASITDNAEQETALNMHADEIHENRSCGSASSKKMDFVSSIEKVGQEVYSYESENDQCEKSSCGSGATVKKDETCSVIEKGVAIMSENETVDEGSKVKEDEVSLKSADAVEDTPPVSEHESDTVSFSCSEDLSAESSSISGGVYPHYAPLVKTEAFHSSNPILPQSNTTFPSSYPHEAPSDEDTSRASQQSEGWKVKTEMLAARDSESLLCKQKSGSLSGLSSVGSTSKLINNFPRRNYSSDNLRISLSKLDQKLKAGDIAMTKSSSSGYESGSHESLPINMKNIKRRSLSHSRMSGSDVSEGFAVDRAHEEERENFDSVKNEGVATAASISSGLASETSSISGSSLSLIKQLPFKSEDSLRLSEVLESQTELEAPGGTTPPVVCMCDKESQTILEEEKEKEGPEMLSQALLHVSDGLEIAIDSNDSGDSVIKLAASVVNVLELEARRSDKNDLLFIDYSATKCDSMVKKRCEERSQKSTPDVCLRVDSGPVAGRFSPLAAKEGHIQLSATGVPLSVKSSTLTSLGAFLEDETASKVVPMKVEVMDVKVTIKDDMPPAYEATTPSDPIVLHVHQATVNRSDDGTFHVTTSSFGGKVALHSSSNPSEISTESNTSAIVVAAGNKKPTDKCGFETFATTKATPNNEENVFWADGDSFEQNERNNNSEDLREESLRKERKKNSEQESGGAVKNEKKENPQITREENLQNEREENLRLRNTVEELRKKLQEIEAERDCLTAALSMMQEDLISSERDRSNLRARSNSQL